MVNKAQEENQDHKDQGDQEENQVHKDLKAKVVVLDHLGQEVNLDQEER